MPLAGTMKLKTFLVLVGTGVVLVAAACVGGSILFGGAVVSEVDMEPPQRSAPEPVAAAPAPAPQAPPSATPKPAPAAGRPVDRVVLGYQGRDLGTKKRKDVTKGKPFKVNVYQDDGHATANRAKADLDRDDRWDEKFTFDGDEITRKVSPADDEDYSESFRWNGSDWDPT